MFLFIDKIKQSYRKRCAIKYYARFAYKSFIEEIALLNSDIRAPVPVVVKDFYFKYCFGASPAITIKNIKSLNLGVYTPLNDGDYVYQGPGRLLYIVLDEKLAKPIPAKQSIVKNSNGYKLVEC